MTEPIGTYENATVWYFEGEERDIKCKHEGKVELYPSWVRLVTPIGTWVPRERVEQVHET